MAQKRAALSALLDQKVPLLESALEVALQQLVERVVVGQPDVTNAMDPADLATLKFNYVQSMNAAKSGVHGLLEMEELERRSKGAMTNSTGDVFVRLNTELSTLLQGPSRLLAQKYSLRAAVPAAKTRPNAEILLSDLMSVTPVEVIGREIDSAVEALGKAKIGLEKAQRDAASRQARDAWDKA
ncbi:hypothetical protein CH252_40575 [Rhodococcus sp. 06-1477-1B]|nr:hypothetical protein CH252_40575 [Rhodococcus sp. 06-1477-1B]